MTSENQGVLRFSILIPTWNNLDYLKLCVHSIRKNSHFRHQILIHVNEGSDGSLEWVRLQPDIEFAFSKSNIGVCYALNILAKMAVTDYILYLNDDMYVCPGWDRALSEEIDRIGHKFFFLSATAIEARLLGPCSIRRDYGQDVRSFDESRLLAEYDSLNIPDWQGATWPPNIVHRDMWHLVGGYSIEFSPGMYSDPDFSMKLWQSGIRVFKGLNASKVYHFGSQSVKRVKKNDGYYKFISKWGVTSRTLTKFYLRRGEIFDGPLVEPRLPVLTNVRNYFRRMISLLT